METFIKKNKIIVLNVVSSYIRLHDDKVGNIEQIEDFLANIQLVSVCVQTYSRYAEVKN